MAFVGEGFDSIVRIRGDRHDDLVLYDTGTGRARFYRTDGGGNLTRYRQLEIGSGWTHLRSGSFGGAPERDLLCFERSTGRAQILLDQGDDEPARIAFEAPRGARATIAVGRFGSSRDAFNDLAFYDADTGRASVFLSDGRANFRPVVRPFDWGPGVTRVVVGSFLGTAPSDLLLYRPTGSDRGEARFVRGTNDDAVFRDPGAPIQLDAWTHAVRARFGEGSHSDVLFYSGRTGVGRFYASDGRGGLSPRADHAAYSFASEWTHLVAARLAPGGYTDFLFYKRSSGIIEIWNVLEGSLARLQSRPHVRLTLEPKRIERGGQATLTWTTREASTVDLQPFPGPDRAGGQTAVRPERTTTYRLVATNEGGMSRAEATLVVEGTEEQEAPRPSPETTPGTLQGSYVRDLLGTQPSSIRVVLQGRWISGSGVEGRTSFTEERPGQIGPGPASVFPFTITNLRRGRWSITASSDLSPPLTCETSIPPGLITFRFGPQGGSCG